MAAEAAIYGRYPREQSLFETEAFAMSAILPPTVVLLRLVVGDRLRGHDVE
jgi:hypothetical protein